MHSRPTGGQWILVETFINGYDKLISNLFWYLADALEFDSSFDYHGSADTLLAHVANALAPSMPAGISFIGANVLFGKPEGTYGVNIYHVTPGTAASGSPMPEDVAVVVQKNTNFFGPTKRGRWYFSGVSSLFQNGNYLNNGGNTLFITIAATLSQNVTVGSDIDISPATFSPKDGTLTQITSALPVNLLGTSRRRRPRF